MWKISGKSRGKEITGLFKPMFCIFPGSCFCERVQSLEIGFQGDSLTACRFLVFRKQVLCVHPYRY